MRLRRGESAVLADYFDLIGGTSTGAIIAAMLSLGQSVEEVRKSYLELGPKVFSVPAFWARTPFIGPKLFTAWSVKPLEQYAKKLFSEKTTLGSKRCLLSETTWPGAVWGRRR